MKIQTPIIGAAIVTVTATAMLAGCSSNTGAPDTPSTPSSSPSESPSSSTTETPQADPFDNQVRNAAAATDCGSAGTSASSGSVTVVNQTNAVVFLKAIEVDCYDWEGKKNPTQFDNYFASSGTSIGPVTLRMRGIPEWGGVIRPWNFTVSARYDAGSSAAGETLTGELASRPTYKFAKGVCYTGAGQTVCDGESLCADDPALEKVTTAMPMRNRAGEVKATFDVVTACTLSDDSATIVFKGAVPTP